jgi:hypothetical protein
MATPWAQRMGMSFPGTLPRRLPVSLGAKFLITLNRDETATRALAAGISKFSFEMGMPPHLIMP